MSLAKPSTKFELEPRCTLTAVFSSLRDKVLKLCLMSVRQFALFQPSFHRGLLLWPFSVLLMVMFMPDLGTHIFIFCKDINKGCLSSPDERVTCGFHFSIFFKTNPHCPVLLDTLSLSTKSSGVVLRVFICSLYEQQAKSRWLRCDRPELAARIVTTAVVSLAKQS